MSSRPAIRRAGRVAAQIIAWVLITLGLAAWVLVFTKTVGGYESEGIGWPLVQIWIWIYGTVAGVGVTLLLAIHEKNPLIARVSLGLYAAPLIAFITSALLSAE